MPTSFREVSIEGCRKTLDSKSMLTFCDRFFLTRQKYQRLMAVKIRMQRGGATHNPHYRVVVTDVRSPRDGRFVEKVGVYDPKNKDQRKQFSLNLDRVDYWLSVGAQPSDTVRSLIKRARRQPTEEVASTEAPSQAEVAAEEVAPVEEVVAEESTAVEAAPEASAEAATEDEAVVAEESLSSEEAPAEEGDSPEKES